MANKPETAVFDEPSIEREIGRLFASGPVAVAVDVFDFAREFVAEEAIDLPDEESRTDPVAFSILLL